jgi:uncharacterized protein YndB with AHSA1/START domain
MLKPILIILAVIVLLILVVLIAAAFRPSDFRVTRSATIAAPPAAVFAHVNDFKLWKPWSPWERLDPAMQRTYEGTAEGVGAIYRWAGNGQVGEGKMTIVESKPGEAIRIAMEFYKPFASTGTAEFTFVATGDGKTTVTWTMSSTNDSLICKAIGMFMDMDKMVGNQFAEGLRNLTAVCEAPVPGAVGTVKP